MEYPIDAFDQKILQVLHEFEYDPYSGSSGPRSRISPVPLYLIRAATCPFAKKIHGRTRPAVGPDVYSRIEALKIFGLVRDGRRNGPGFTYLLMRDGRFISVEIKHSEVSQRGKAAGRKFNAESRFVDYHIYFGLSKEFRAALRAAGYPKTAKNEVYHSVMKSFPWFGWCYYNPKLEKQKCKKKGLRYREIISNDSNCYSLTQIGIRVARGLGTWGAEEPGENKTIGDRACKVLIAMATLHAFDSDSRQPTDKIASEAFGTRADANSLKSVIKKLKIQKLIDTKTGRGGGCWLTDAGRLRAQKLQRPT